jgi:hypothetical protein
MLNIGLLFLTIITKVSHFVQNLRSKKPMLIFCIDVIVLPMEKK